MTVDEVSTAKPSPNLTPALQHKASRISKFPLQARIVFEHSSNGGEVSLVTCGRTGPTPLESPSRRVPRLCVDW
jgi:hypothetical protein